MAIRKEQVLFGIVALLAVWIWSGLGAGEEGARKVVPKQLEYQPPGVRSLGLVAGAAPALARADLFAEPRETRALPPRELAFPPHAPLTVAALPLDPGPDYAHLLTVSVDGRMVEGVTLRAAGETPAAAESAEEAPKAQDPAARRAVLAQTYDQLYLQGLNVPYFGIVEVVGMDRFDAEKLRDFDGKVVQFRQYSETTGRIGRLESFDRNDPRKVREIKLAASLRNEVTRQVRDVPADAAHLEDRARLIEWLLGKAREAAWVYDEAQNQAVLYSQISGGDLEGLRWQLRVLQARGDLNGEYQLLAGIQGEHRETAFRYEGLGRIASRLGLFADAERDLRKAVELGRNDARPHAALAEFLRERGRIDEALALAQRAEATMGGLLDASDRARVVRTIAACRLSVGDRDGARTVLSSGDRTQAYALACLHYAAGDLPAALDAFRAASAGPDGPAALLGQGAVLLRQQQWQEAHDAFVAVAEQAPLLRHRAWSGLGLLFHRLGQFDQALAWCERSLEAFPNDPYALYLRGRTLRLQGQLAGAEEALAATLRQRDDFVHAIAEMAQVQQQKAAETRGEEQATATLYAMRYGKRAIDLAPMPVVELFEFLGAQQFAAGNARNATATFALARDTAAQEADKLYAKGAIAVVDYSRGQVDEAIGALQRFAELPKDHPMRLWAEATLQAIDDHAQKEMLEDRFERQELGGIWSTQRDGQLGAKLADNQLLFRDRFGRQGQGEVWAERQNAVRGKNFLAVGCSLRFGPNQPRGEGFAGLRIETQRGSTGQADFQVQLGIREGQPHLRILDNREEPKVVPITVPGFAADVAQQLELRVVPRGEANSRMFALQVRWNDLLVHEQEVKSLGGSTGGELHTVLFVQGNKGSEVDVAFDDYRLERRKDVSR